MYDVNKYQFVEHTSKKDGTREVIALSNFAGQRVRAAAKYNPEDVAEYAFGTGCMIAGARCYAKVMRKRKRLAEQNRLDAKRELEIAQARFEKASQSLERANQEQHEADKYLEDILKEI